MTYCMEGRSTTDSYQFRRKISVFIIRNRKPTAINYPKKKRYIFIYIKNIQTNWNEFSRFMIIHQIKSSSAFQLMWKNNCSITVHHIVIIFRQWYYISSSFLIFSNNRYIFASIDSALGWWHLHDVWWLWSEKSRVVEFSYILGTRAVKGKRDPLIYYTRIPWLLSKNRKTFSSP